MTGQDQADEVVWTVRDGYGDDAELRRLLELLFAPDADQASTDDDDEQGGRS